MGNFASPTSALKGPHNGVDWPTEPMMNQVYFIAERVLGTDESMGIGARADLPYGEDYVLTLSQGWEVNHGAANWNSNEYDRLVIPQLCGEVGSQDLSFKLDHVCTVVGYEDATAVGNFFSKRSYSYMFGGPFTRWGGLRNWRAADKSSRHQRHPRWPESAVQPEPRAAALQRRREHQPDDARLRHHSEVLSRGGGPLPARPQPRWSWPVKLRTMTLRRLSILSGSVLVVACCAAVVHRVRAQPAVEQRFDQLDRDGDGGITPDELPAAAFFRRLDLDADGTITKPEAVEAVRRGALKDLRGSKGGAASIGAVAAAESGQPSPAEPPVREGPKPVRPGDHGVGRRIGDLAVTDLASVKHTLPSAEPSKIMVFAMTSTSCPISRRYLPRLKEIVVSSGDGISWVLVNPVATDKPADMRTAAAEFTGCAIYVHDPWGELAAAIGAVTTTDVVVVAADRTIAYHGAIDDQYGFGYSIETPRRRYLVDALAAIRAGDTPPVAATEAPGCVLDTQPAEKTATAVTYHGRISRIVERHCVECHRDGGVGPFPLDTYDDLVAHAAMVRTVVERGTMPPWFAAPAPTDAETGRVHTPWANDRSLAEAEKRDLRDWLVGGRPMGDPADAPARRPRPGAWQIGTPDAVFEFAEPVAVKATGVMPYQTVIVETHLPEDRWVRAIEVQPGDKAVVHHALIHLAGADEQADDPRDFAAEERGGFWGEYVPGQNTLVYPEGFARRLPKAARLRFQMHYTPNGTATTDRTRVGLIYAKEPPQHEVRVAGIVNARISIPPGAADHREEASLRLPFDATIMGFLPHLHVRGKACRYELVRTGGGRTTLLDIPRYDFNWQLLYRRHEPLPLAAGDTLLFTAWFDNSAGNPANPDPTKTIRWGPQTFDEMHLGYVEYFVPGITPGDALPSLRKRPGRVKGPR